MFSFHSMIHEYHEYRMIWNNPIAGEELTCDHELDNSHNPYAVVVKKTICGEQKIVMKLKQEAMRPHLVNCFMHITISIVLITISF